MKKNIILFCVIVGFMNTHAILLESGKNIIELSTQVLTELPQKEILTEREKNGEVKIETWQGPLLLDILINNSIEDYNKIQIAASDNYMVRLEKDEITDHAPIIALTRNNEVLGEKEFRLIIPGKRDMFWIRDIARIAVEDIEQMPPPQKIFIAETILSRKPLLQDPEPFADAAGYFLRDLLQEVYAMQAGSYLLVARDNVRHTLDFDNYLAKAVLLKSETGFAMQSPQMPAGMWIKDLAYIQKDEIGIIFSDQFNNWQEILELLDWNDHYPETGMEFNKMLQEKEDQKREFFELKWSEE